MGFVYIQVNETQACIYRTFKYPLVVVLEVLFPYGFIYEMGPPKNLLAQGRKAIRPNLLFLVLFFIFLFFFLPKTSFYSSFIAHPSQQKGKGGSFLVFLGMK